MKIRITRIFIIFAILMLAITLALLFGLNRTEKSVERMQGITQEYIEGQNSIDEMREVSDYLTEKCRAFVVTGNSSAAIDYFDEIENQNRREEALGFIEKYGKTDTVYVSLEKALNSSNELAEVEVYAMRLACEGYGIDPASISASLKDIELSSEDMALSDPEQISKSREMVFDEAYENKKAEIWSSVYASLEELMKETRGSQLDSYTHSQKLIRAEILLMALLLLVTIVMMLITAKMTVIPLRDSTAMIKNKSPLPVLGSVEYMYLAEAYNSMLEASNERQELLSYEATHDELTDLYNRKMFESKRLELQNDNTAMIIVDVDRFKSFNDTYGHDTGDRILKKVAGTLSASFRSEDYVCRIGGDEFAVLMVHVTPEHRSVIESKLNSVRKALDKPDDLPEITLSIGVAFSSDTEGAKNRSEDLFRKADEALYESKSRGRDTYSFFRDINK
jgi:diguanylate cyclase (GGDEF)-like protein